VHFFGTFGIIRQLRCIWQLRCNLWLRCSLR
jgi:hypothetical protein